ncbi:hypothetical protein [Pseudomonas fragi]|uniref:hypothetical protein n=1 Tax=Pseudomonas fragi TaxID=296 RepID=UPI001F45C433|nr:hypothetical protein [Pseudomonas fragi]MCF6760383.1 hypothetical protein [Pseudomonas fragi]
MNFSLLAFSGSLADATVKSFRAESMPSIFYLNINNLWKLKKIAVARTTVCAATVA